MGFIAGCMSIIVAACVCLLAITACGSSNSRPSASSSASNSRAGAIEFADCMRSHGVPNFPDPNAQGEIQGNFNLQSPQFQAAQNKCRKFEPRRSLSPTQQQALFTGTLAFSVCMRAHGVTQFPDPQKTYNGVVIAKIDDTSGSGLNPYSPAFRNASKACYRYQLRARSAANQLGAGLPRPPPPSLGPGHEVSGG